MKNKGKIVAHIGLYSLLFCLYKALDQSYEKVSEHPIFSIVLLVSVLLMIYGIELCCSEN